MTIIANPFGAEDLCDTSIAERIFEGMAEPDTVAPINGATGKRSAQAS
ncbi:MAG: hypothetical protein WBH04_13245 [Albidovulum sp.]